MTKPDIVSQTAVLAVLDQAECRHIDQLSELSGIANRGVVKAVGKLVSRGLAERREVGCFVLSEAGATWRARGKPITGGPRGPLNQVCRRPRKTTLPDLVWRALRIKRKATIPELLQLAGFEGKDAADRASRYLRALARAGIVTVLATRVEGTAPTSNGYKRWALIDDPGPLAPIARVRVQVLYDPNAGRLIDYSGAAS